MLAITLSVGAEAITSRVIASVRTQTTPALPCRQSTSSAGGSGAPSLRSTAHAASSVASVAEGILRVSRTLGFDMNESWSVAVRLAVAAVVARNRRLDDAGAVGIGAGRQDEHPVAGVPSRLRAGQTQCVDRNRVHERRAADPAGHVPGDDVAHQRPHLLLGHASVST